MNETEQRPRRTALYACVVGGIVLTMFGAAVSTAPGSAAPVTAAALLAVGAVLLLVSVIAIGVEIGIRNARLPR